MIPALIRDVSHILALPIIGGYVGALWFACPLSRPIARDLRRR